MFIDSRQKLPFFFLVSTGPRKRTAPSVLPLGSGRPLYRSRWVSSSPSFFARGVTVRFCVIMDPAQYEAGEPAPADGEHVVVPQMLDFYGMDVVDQDVSDFSDDSSDPEQVALSPVALMRHAFPSLMPRYPRQRHNWLAFGSALQRGDESVVTLRSLEPAGWTPLHYAAYHNKLEYTQLLIARRAEIDAAAQISGDTPLHACARRGDRCADAVIALLKANADIHAPCARGARTPLHLAASMGNLRLIRILIAWGARPNQLASFVGDSGCAMSIVNPLVSVTPLCDAIRLAKSDAAKLLVDAGADPKNDKSSPSIAEVAARKGGEALESYRRVVAYANAHGL